MTCWAQVLVSFHNSAPFGAVGSVNAWERVGALLLVRLRCLFMIPAFRYVDDLFSFDRRVKGRWVTVTALWFHVLRQARDYRTQRDVYCAAD